MKKITTKKILGLAFLTCSLLVLPVFASEEPLVVKILPEASEDRSIHNVTGVFATMGSFFTVRPLKMTDISPYGLSTIKTGVVKNVDIPNGTFIFNHNGRTLTVKTTASTTFVFGGVESSALSLLTAGSIAHVVTATTTDDEIVVTAVKVITPINAGEQSTLRVTKNSGEGKTRRSTVDSLLLKAITVVTIDSEN